MAARYGFVVGGFDATLQGVLQYEGDSYPALQREDNDLLGRQPSYTVADFSAGLSKNSYSLTLFIRNAFDERGRTTTFAKCAVSTCGVNPYYVPNQPRTIGLKFTQEF
jgi:outer membrane receptor protein involved in Fe transport